MLDSRIRLPVASRNVFAVQWFKGSSRVSVDGTSGVPIDFDGGLPGPCPPPALRPWLAASATIPGQAGPGSAGWRSCSEAQRLLALISSACAGGGYLHAVDALRAAAVAHRVDRARGPRPEAVLAARGVRGRGGGAAPSCPRAARTGRGMGRSSVAVAGSAAAAGCQRGWADAVRGADPRHQAPLLRQAAALEWREDTGEPQPARRRRSSGCRAARPRRSRVSLGGAGMRGPRRALRSTRVAPQHPFRGTNRESRRGLGRPEVAVH